MKLSDEKLQTAEDASNGVGNVSLLFRVGSSRQSKLPLRNLSRNTVIHCQRIPEVQENFSPHQ